MSSMMNSEPYFYIHDVFLSFRGKDTRASFISHLYASLQNAGINVFKDDESLQAGDDISDSLLRTIEQSKIYVVVFSRNYGESRWCMQELVHIMKCRRTTGRVVVPVFFDVNPFEVRHQKGHFGEAFRNLSNRFIIDKKNVKISTKIIKLWMEALDEAAGISGLVVLNSRTENETIKNIVQNVTHLLDKTELFVADNPVGVEPRVQEIIQVLDQKLSNDVLLLGMWGMGGIGKTTIAKAIYNKIGRNFEGRSFLAHIREVWEQDAGQVHLQEQLLFDIYKESKIKIRNVEAGKIILKERFCHKRVILVLDDVNELDQLNALCGSRKWFGQGSRIIITTRNHHILKGNRVDEVYIMKGMDESESIELFSWHAFKQASPIENFTQLSSNVTTYSGGLPLALEVLGCYLFATEVSNWESVLEKLKRIPNHQVQKKLKISYDGLNDDTEREIFLDIASFFIGMDRNDVTHILNDSGLFAENGIRVLVERSLVTIDDKNKLGMHDLLRDMGREIIRSKSPKKLEKRSRLWFHEDVLDILSKEIGTKAIEGLALKLPTNNSNYLRVEAFKKMKKLRLLQLAGVHLNGDFKYFSRDLKWLCWNGFPLEFIPTNFYQGSLVSIELQNSKVRYMWKTAQLMKKLKILNLSHSHYLIQTPDFSNLPNLEKLELIDCPRLSEVSDTIGHLSKVLQINLQDCTSLYDLPRSIYTLKSLKTLILSGCSKIEKLEEDLEQMESLTILVADKTAIKTVPFSIIRSKSIGYISLCGYKGLSRDVFPSIIRSWMSPTNSLSSHIQISVDMSSLVSLEVPSSSFHHLSYISKDLLKLQSLSIQCGSELQLSQDTKSILDVLFTTDCEEMESITTTSEIPNMDAFTLTESNSEVQISGSRFWLKCLLIQMGMSCQITHILKQRILQNWSTNEGGGHLLVSDSYPDWLTFNREGYSVIFEIPRINGHNLKTMMCHVHYSSPDKITYDGLRNLLLINHTKATIQLYKRDALASFEDEDWERVVSNIEPGNKVEVVVVFKKRLIVKKTTVYLIYKPMDEKMEHFHLAHKKEIVSSSDENEYAVRSICPQECNKFFRGDHETGIDGGHSNAQCQICSKFGHIASSCYHRFNPNYVAESNFQFQNQSPQQHEAVQPICPPSEGGSLPHQQQFHSFYMHPSQVQPLQQAYHIPCTQDSQFQTVSPTSMPPMSCPQAYITNSGSSEAPPQQSHQMFTSSGTSRNVILDPIHLEQAQPVQGQEHFFLGNNQGLPIQYCFDLNYVAESNFQFQNQFPLQHAAIEPTSQGGFLSHQPHDHFSYMHPSQVQPVQHSQFQTMTSTSVPAMSFPIAYITNSRLPLAPTQQSKNWFIQSGTSHYVTSNPTNLVQVEPVQGQEHVFIGNAQGLPIQYHFHPNSVAQSNFLSQNQLPQQHAVMQPIFQPSQDSLLSHQQQDHFSYMHPTQVQLLQQAHQISDPQHSQFQTMSFASVPPMSIPDAYITNSGLSQTPTQQSQNLFINSGTSHHLTSNPTNLVQAEPVQGQDHFFPDNAQG